MGEPADLAGVVDDHVRVDDGVVVVGVGATKGHREAKGQGQGHYSLDVNGETNQGCQQCQVWDLPSV